MVSSSNIYHHSIKTKQHPPKKKNIYIQYLHTADFDGIPKLVILIKNTSSEKLEFFFFPDQHQDGTKTMVTWPAKLGVHWSRDPGLTTKINTQ